MLGFFKKYFGAKNSAPVTPWPTVDMGAFIPRTSSGLYITAESAMACSAVYACTNLIAGAISCLPLLMYRGGLGEERKPIQSHPVLRLFGAPNSTMTSATFWSIMTRNKLLGGRAVAVIEWDGRGGARAVWPILYRNVTVYRAWELGLQDKLPDVNREDLFFLITPEGAGGKQVLLPDEDVLHIPNIGLDGKVGVSAVRAGANAVGMAMAAEEHSGRFFSQGTATNFALKYPAKLSPEAIENLLDQYKKRKTGLANHWLPLVLTEGGDVVNISMTAKDAELIASREFQIADICRFFGTPPVMIGETEKTSSWGSGVEQMARWFAQFTVNSHLIGYEQEIKRKIIGQNAPETVEFDETELTRGDTATRATFYNMARGSLTQPGWMTVNEIRAAENLPPIAEGNSLQKPAQRAAQPAPQPQKGDDNAS